MQLIGFDTAMLTLYWQVRDIRRAEAECIR